MPIPSCFVCWARVLTTKATTPWPPTTSSAICNALASAQRSALYAMGVMAYRQGDDVRAINYLGRVTATDDALSQNAYLYIGQAYLRGRRQEQRPHGLRDGPRRATTTLRCARRLSTTTPSVSTTGRPRPSTIRWGCSSVSLNEFPESRYADRINDYLVEVLHDDP